MSEPKTERLREHPEPRFAAEQHEFNLSAAAAELKNEKPSGEAGHRQKTLYKLGGTTVSLFVFGNLTHLPPHRTKGVVTIHALAGHLQVTAEKQVHNLQAGQLLVLAPGVEHHVVARQESQMLLTVNLKD